MILAGLESQALESQTVLVSLRRRLHAVPELGLKLPETEALVIRALEALPLTVNVQRDISGIVAVLEGAGGSGRGPIVLLRADMDALPLTERTGLPFACTEPRMHACGHDLHTAMLVGAAKLLVEHRQHFDGRVVFMFQPGEEGYDGARHMIDAGMLMKAGRLPDAAYALHVNPAVLPFGTVATRPGTLLSAVSCLRVTVHGAGGHGSRPHRAKDPIPVAAEITLALQAMITRQFDVFDPVILTVGVLQSGTKFNIIPDEARLEATVRTFSDEHANKVAEATRRLCAGIADAHGMSVDVEFEHLYPATNNDPQESARFLRVAAELFGAQKTVEYPHPQPGSEDFSRVLAAIPGAMAFLGACPPNRNPETADYNHSAGAIYDEAILSRGAALLAAMALDRLSDTKAQ